jgi:hypothetical protein
MSERRNIDQERAASSTFFRQVLREDKDHAFVIHFDREVEELQELTESQDKLQAALGELATPSRESQNGGQQGGGHPGNGGGRGGHHGHGGGGTHLYDVVFLASDEVK